MAEEEPGPWPCPICRRPIDVFMRPKVLFRATDLEQAVRKTVDAEREACAQLADNFEMETGPFSTKQKRLIAKAIRDRT